MNESDKDTVYLIEDDDSDRYKYLAEDRPRPIIKQDSGEIDGDRLISVVMSATSFSFRCLSIVMFMASLIDVVPYVWILPIKAATLLILAKFVDKTRDDLMKYSEDEKKRKLNEHV